MWHALSKEAVLAELESKEEGLSEEEVATRLQKYGFNKLQERKRAKALILFLQEFRSPLVYILVAAAVISLLLAHLIDFYVIIAIVLLNSCLGFSQHYRAEKAIQNLKQLLVPKAKVIREGKLKEISSHYLVPGDILIVGEGDKISADARIFEATNLQVNEAVLTGESMPSDKFSAILPAETSLADRENMIYAGTEVVRGNGKAIVTETGMSTELGKIAQAVQQLQPEPTPMQKSLSAFSKKLTAIVVVLAIIVTGLGLIVGMGKFDMFLTGISLAVSAIPEGLPAVITICLAFAIQRMYRANALVRKLAAAETLGCTTVILADKTGTITAEKMTVTTLYTNKKFLDVAELKNPDAETMLLLKIGCLCNNARLEAEKDKEGKEKEYMIGDPTEKALLLAAKQFGLDKSQLTQAEPRVIEFPFTSERKLMTIVRKRKDGKGATAYVKGAPDIILQRCGKEIINGKVTELTVKRKKQLFSAYEKLAASALRVLAFAYKPLSEARAKSQEAAEYGLIFVGFQGMFDPPKTGVREAVQQCKAAGINVVMITGDSALTAKAVSAKIGLKGKVMTAQELDKLSDEELIKALDKTRIFARVSPEHKLRIVNAFKARGEIVAVTGDGVNDSPALKRADIGVAMGIRGSDVARDVADVVLLDDNFASIVAGVREGRRIYDNIKKFTKFLLAVNFDELLIIIAALFARLPLPLLPLQILWLNLVTDSLPALALSTEPAEKNVMARPPRKKEEGILTGMAPFLIAAGILATITTFAAFMLYLPHIEKARTAALTTAVLFELFFVFTCRSNKPIKDIGFFSNRLLLAGVAAAASLHLVAIYTPLSMAFKFVPLSFSDWLKIIPLSCSGLIIFEAEKLVRGKRRKK